MGLCTTRKRVYVLFLTITILQIVTTGARQIFDFMGPLWSMILTNFLNIVFSIFGFFGGYTRRKHYLVSYIVWSILWTGWNVFIVCLYVPLPSLDLYKSPILSLGTGGFSWWETRAPGCEPDWTGDNHLVVTKCMFDPRVMEFIQAGIQVCLAATGIIFAFSLVLCPLYGDDEKDASKQNAQQSQSVPAFLSLSRQNVSSHSRASNRHYHRAPLGLPGSSNNAGGDSSDQVGSNVLDDRLRPMTPRRVKRRSARSIQSQRFGPSTSTHPTQDNSDKPSTSRGTSSGGTSARSSLRSTNSRKSHRNSKRKNNHFVSPVNRLMQQQVDSETSHDEPRRYAGRDQLHGHVNPVYLGGPQSPKYSGPHAPPRPPSARSSYSNYHPARLPINSNPDLPPNVINLNQNIFTNGGFDMSTEYNLSQTSNNTNNALYEDDINLNPNPNNYNSTMSTNNPTLPMPNGFSLSFKPQNSYNGPGGTSGGVNRTSESLTQNSVFAYPLAHSPVSQESFPMWGVSSQPQSPQTPLSNLVPLSPRSPPYQNRPILKLQQHPYNNGRQPSNSETVI